MGRKWKAKRHNNWVNNGLIGKAKAVYASKAKTKTNTKKKSIHYYSAGRHSATSWKAGLWYAQCLLQKAKYNHHKCTLLLSLSFSCWGWHHVGIEYPFGQFWVCSQSSGSSHPPCPSPGYWLPGEGRGCKESLDAPYPLFSIHRNIGVLLTPFNPKCKAQ